MNELLSPIEKLPAELFRDIFLGCVSNDFSSPFRVSEVPLSVISTCRRWRAIGIGTPRLWTVLRVDIGRVCSANEVFPEEPNGLSVLDVWLARSCQLPLSVNIVHGETLSSCSGIGASLLARHAHRWKSVRLSVPKDCPCIPTFQDAFRDAQNLRELRILHSDNGSRRISWDHPLLCLQFSTPLQQLTVLDIGHTRDLFPVEIFTETTLPLRELRLISVSPAPDVFAFINQCRSLETVDVSFKDFRLATQRHLPVHLPGHILTLSRLHTLKLSCGTPFLGENMDISPFMRQLHLPALKCLSIDCKMYSSFLPWEDIARLVRQSIHRVTDLRVNGLLTSGGQKIDLLRNSRELKTLEGDNLFFCNELMVALSEMTYPALCPLLDVFDYSGHFSARSQCHVVAQMITNRWSLSERGRFATVRMVARPREVNFLHDSHIKIFRGLPTIAKCIEGGLKVGRLDEV